MKDVNAIITIAARDITKLLRDRARILANFIFPVIFVGVLGNSIQSNLGPDLKYDFLTFVLIGVIGQTLFQSTASGMVSLIEDRQNDFAQELFISPISRLSIIVGKIVGETVVSFIQILAVILFGLAIGVHLDLFGLVRLLPVFFIISLFGGGFGILIMANLQNQRSADQIFPFVLFPQFFLSGVFNPIKNLPLPLTIASRIAPMTYAIDLIRSVYYAGSRQASYTVLFPFWLSLLVVSALTVIFILAGTWLFIKNERQR